ncbi:MAG: CRTAC1 family protein, partial [bacterium]|nr:CRTAC1 family protein [bacterium]
MSAVVAFRLSIADVNGDLYPDILAHVFQNDSTGDVLDKQFLYLNVQGDDPGDPTSRKFIDYTAQSGIRANRQGTPDGRHSDSGIFADVDNDGDLDLFTMVYVHTNYGLEVGTNDLLLNDGSGHFTLAPNSPFHTEEIYNTAAGAFLDYDNDGNVDLFIGNYYRPSLTVDQLYRGHGDGSFTNVTSAAGIDVDTTCIYGVAAADWNNDGFMDLFVPPYSNSVSGSTPILWKNNGNGTFSQVETTANYDGYRGVGTGRSSFGSMPWDYDNDGDVDFFEILVHGSGDAGSGVHSTVVTNEDNVFSWDFYRVSGRGGEDPDLTHHGDHYASWFDMDNDGLTDLALTECGYSNNRIYIFKQAFDHTFSPVTATTGLDSINGADLPPHNVMPMDYDLDGDEDLLVGFASADPIPVQLWRNEIGTDNNRLTVTLRGAGGAGKSNRSAIGARVQVTAGGRTYTQEVYAGNGHQGPQMPLSRSFGLGSASVVDEVRVEWPNADHTTTVLTDVAVNQFLEIEEPSSDVCEIDLVANTHTCAGVSAITFVEGPNSGEAVLKVNLDPNESGFRRAIFEVEYGASPADWTVNIGDSESNNGGGGDGADQSNDAELHVLGTTMKVFGKGGTPTYPLAEVPGLVQYGTLLTLDVSNEQLRWHNYNGQADSLVSPYLYALDGQPDSEGPVNYEVYAAFNRTIGTSGRDGSGVTRVRIRLFSESTVCDIDLVNDTH